jgi:hypothetical protein
VKDVVQFGFVADDVYERLPVSPDDVLVPLDADPLRAPIHSDGMPWS